MLRTADARAKAARTHRAWWGYLGADGTGGGGRAGQVGRAAAPDAPSRPARPALVPAREVPALKQSPLPVNAHVLHNLAHIELNAIDLAWDTLMRFSHLPLPRQFFEVR